jgi:hypothetical protein
LKARPRKGRINKIYENKVQHIKDKFTYFSNCWKHNGEAPPEKKKERKKEKRKKERKKERKKKERKKGRRNVNK